MNSSESISRRILLKIIAGVSVASCFWPSSVLAKWKIFPQECLEGMLTGLFAHKKSAIFVGQKYLEKVPNEANVSLLVDLIGLPQSNWSSKLTRWDKNDIKGLIRQQQMLDFECNRIEKIEGWVLSKTEVRLCALASLFKL